MNDEKMSDRGPAMQSAVLLNNDGGKLSGPLTPPALSFFMAAWTLLGVNSTNTEPRWPSGNTLAFNAENPVSTPGLVVM
jgi:hypothetical protein